MSSREHEITRRIDESETRIAKAIFPATINHHNTLFGGTAMAWMDEVSFIAATRFCRLPLVTVASARGHKVVNTRLTVQVDVYVDGRYANGRELAISGAFSFVAVDEQKRPVPVLPDYS